MVHVNPPLPRPDCAGAARRIEVPLLSRSPCAMHLPKYCKRLKTTPGVMKDSLTSLLRSVVKALVWRLHIASSLKYARCLRRLKSMGARRTPSGCLCFFEGKILLTSPSTLRVCRQVELISGATVMPTKQAANVKEEERNSTEPTTSTHSYIM